MVGILVTYPLLFVYSVYHDAVSLAVALFLVWTVTVKREWLSSHINRLHFFYWLSRNKGQSPWQSAVEAFRWTF